MAGFSDYLEDKVLDHVFGGNAYTAPSTLYVALYTVAPTDTGGGTEVSGGSYARQSGAFTVSGTPTNVNCATGTVGSIALNISGGTVAVDYNYNWEETTQTVLGSGTGNSIADLSAGDYDITVTDANGVAINGTPVTFSANSSNVVFKSAYTDTSNRKLTYTSSLGVATTYVAGWVTGPVVVTATAGTKSVTTTINFVGGAASARTIAVTSNGSLAVATVKDRFGNAVSGVTVAWSRTGTGYFGNGTSATTGTTNADGVAEIAVTGDATVKGLIDVATYTQADDLAGYVGTTATSGTGASLSPAGVASATVVMSVANTAADNAQAATDAAAEATDAANAATDAANAAAEAADAATAAAQDAADAVAALSTQVSEMVNALKKQITALTNLVIKIQKKVKA